MLSGRRARGGAVRRARGIARREHHLQHLRYCLEAPDLRLGRSTLREPSVDSGENCCEFVQLWRPATMTGSSFLHELLVLLPAAPLVIP